MLFYSYDARIKEDPKKEQVKSKFANTIQFVEDYLLSFVSQDNVFADREQNKLTYEVRVVDIVYSTSQNLDTGQW
jgi:hypothetical protein